MRAWGSDPGPTSPADLGGITPHRSLTYRFLPVPIFDFLPCTGLNFSYRREPNSHADASSENSHADVSSENSHADAQARTLTCRCVERELDVPTRRARTRHADASSEKELTCRRVERERTHMPMHCGQPPSAERNGLKHIYHKFFSQYSCTLLN